MGCCFASRVAEETRGGDRVVPERPINRGVEACIGFAGVLYVVVVAELVGVEDTAVFAPLHN